ncbi:3-oxoacyl-ACP reductase FabG [Halosegnis marinus]|uniref:3-oxoacyl-ACP reductase FabG n=1 Tax=Halosegnis marinus TaxID=3034023 RepID=A0ABD5ZRW3_9EURY|nr:3-oxoacyl-ACP reductase FabG [Halosegnis sp. DT85]
MLAGKTCVVTGGSRGIGRSIATELARYGATVAVNYVSSETAAGTVVEDIRGAGGDAEAVRADVADAEAVASMAERVHGAFGPIDVLVNNAGVTADGRFENLTREDWDRVVDVNLGGAFNCTKAFYDDIVESPAGRVINVSSIVAQQGNFGQANYAASKSGLFGFTKSLARELARHGATANCIAPGFTETDMVEGMPDAARERTRARIPLDRFADATEIGPVARFLASDGASYVTGEIVNVNGGMYG